MWEIGLARYTPKKTALYNNGVGILNNKRNEWRD